MLALVVIDEERRLYAAINCLTLSIEAIDSALLVLR